MPIEGVLHLQSHSIPLTLHYRWALCKNLSYYRGTITGIRLDKRIFITWGLSTISIPYNTKILCSQTDKRTGDWRCFDCSIDEIKSSQIWLSIAPLNAGFFPVNPMQHVAACSQPITWMQIFLGCKILFFSVKIHNIWHVTTKGTYYPY